MFASANRTESSSLSQSQTNIAFQRLDTDIRYAAGISVPDTVGSDFYVEYLTTNTGTPICTELRLNVAAKQLQRRTWTQDNPAPPTPWIPLASSVSSSTPFEFHDADATYNFQRLRLNIVASQGGQGPQPTVRTDITFTALNTSLSTSSATVCTEGRAIP
jgi:hypothetical protein